MAPRVRKHACTRCDKIHHNPDDLTAHMIREHDHPELVCSQTGCKKTFKAPRTLKRHLKEQHEKQTFSCSNCDYSCARWENLKRHEKSCSRKHRQAGRADDAAAVSASVPPLPAAVPMTLATDVFAGVFDSASETMSRTSSFGTSSFSSLAFSGLTIDPTLSLPLAGSATISSCSRNELWMRLCYLAIGRVEASLATRYPGGDKGVLARLERIEMQELILEEFNNGRICGTIADKWFNHLNDMAICNFGLSDLGSDTWQQ